MGSPADRAEDNALREQSVPEILRQDTGLPLKEGRIQAEVIRLRVELRLPGLRQFPGKGCHLFRLPPDTVQFRSGLAQLIPPLYQVIHAAFRGLDCQIPRLRQTLQLPCYGFLCLLAPGESFLCLRQTRRRLFRLLLSGRKLLLSSCKIIIKMEHILNSRPPDGGVGDKGGILLSDYRGALPQDFDRLLQLSLLTLEGTDPLQNSVRFGLSEDLCCSRT